MRCGKPIAASRDREKGEGVLRTLILTLPPLAGGVPAMTRWLCEHLRARGRAPTVAYYATFGCDSD